MKRCAAERGATERGAASTRARPHAECATPAASGTRVLRKTPHGLDEPTPHGLDKPSPIDIGRANALTRSAVPRARPHAERATPAASGTRVLKTTPHGLVTGWEKEGRTCPEAGRRANSSSVCCACPHARAIGVAPVGRHRIFEPFIRHLVSHDDKLRPERPMMARRMGLTDGLPHRSTLDRTDGAFAGPAQGRVRASLPRVGGFRH